MLKCPAGLRNFEITYSTRLLTKSFTTMTTNNKAVRYLVYLRPDKRSLLRFIIFAFVLAWYSGASAISYYSRTSGAWNNPGTWWTEANGSIVNNGTYPKAGDIVYILDVHKVTITGDAACKVLNIGGGNSGVLLFGGKGYFTLSVDDIIINKGAKLQYTSNSGRIHHLNILGSLTNNGVVNFYHDKNDFVILTFMGSGNSMVTGTGRWASLSYMIMSKTSKMDSVSIISPGFGEAISYGSVFAKYPYDFGQNPPVIFKRGTFIYDCPDYLSNLFDPGMSDNLIFTINPEVVIKVKNGTIDMACYPDNKSNGFCLLQGKLVVTGGVVNISQGYTSGNMAGIYYSSSSLYTPRLDVKGGMVNCYGFVGPETSGDDGVDFAMSGGIFTVNKGDRLSSVRPFWITDVTTSSVDFTGGSIVIEQSPTGAFATRMPDFDLGGTHSKSFNVSGKAMVQFGNAETPITQTMSFAAVPGVIYPHILVADPGPGRFITVRPYNDADYSILSLTIEEHQAYENKDILTNGRDHMMTITSDNNMFSIYNDGTFDFLKGTVKFTGNSSQTFGGLALDPFE
jgi:hypothetical protein